MAKGFWITDCPQCGTRNLVADNGKSISKRVFFVIRVFLIALVFQEEPGGYTGATCRACGFRRPKEPLLESD